MHRNRRVWRKRNITFNSSLAPAKSIKKWCLDSHPRLKFINGQPPQCLCFHTFQLDYFPPTSLFRVVELCNVYPDPYPKWGQSHIQCLFRYFYPSALSPHWQNTTLLLTRNESLTKMQLNILHLQSVWLAMPCELAGGCHHALNEIISNLQQHLLWGEKSSISSPLILIIFQMNGTIKQCNGQYEIRPSETTASWNQFDYTPQNILGDISVSPARDRLIS